MTIVVKNGLIYDDHNRVVDVLEADRIAAANGHVYAERFVAAYDGQTLQLDHLLKVKP